MTLLAIDGNSILNRAFYGIRMLTSSKGVPTNALFGFFNIYLKEAAQVQPDGVAVAFDLRSPTFRHKAVASYKANRKGMPEELAQQLAPVKELLRGMVDRHPMVLQDPPPMVKVKEHAASSVNLLVRVWCKSEDYWDLQFDLLEQVKLAFDENGLSIPFQQLDVHLPAPAKTE